MSDNVFTENYPGSDRITLRGSPGGGVAILKVFSSPASNREAATARAQRAGRSGGVYPIRTARVRREAGETDGDFSKRVRTEAVKMAESFGSLVWDQAFGFARQIEEEEVPWQRP
jgi:hypothetical protein